MERRKRLTDTAGRALGSALSPLAGALSALRRARVFHPRGLVCGAEVLPAAVETRLGFLAARLAGPAVVRWSSALWKRGEAPDVLGCAVRFTRAPLQLAPRGDDQDLLLATIQRPWSMAGAPFTTHPHDFLDNSYFGVSPFEVEGLAGERVEFRIVPERPSPPAGSRAERLEQSINLGAARLALELAPYSGPWRRPDAGRFERVAVLHLSGWLELDQEALRFDPFRSGRGLRPVGLVHAMRSATYAESQQHRPLSS